MHYTCNIILSLSRFHKDEPSVQRGAKKANATP